MSPLKYVAPPGGVEVTLSFEDCGSREGMWTIISGPVYISLERLINIKLAIRFYIFMDKTVPPNCH